ncbi:MAG: alpha/beta hydrolase [Spirochaetia bacterium]|nr:alpha/beta hydrolase [Spirochaetia bacterium]
MLLWLSKPCYANYCPDSTFALIPVKARSPGSPLEKTAPGLTPLLDGKAQNLYSVHMKLFRYTEAPSVQSVIFEKILWASKIKESTMPPVLEYKKRDYSKALISPSPPEYLKLRVEIRSESFESMKIYCIEPKDRFPTLTVLFFHGGSYLYNATRPHWRFLASLVESSGCRVLAPDYPLAPEHNYADAYRQLLPYYKNLSRQVVPEDLVLMGDSAGGGLSLGLAMAARDEGLKPGAAIVLLSPWLDVTMGNPHIEVIDPEDPFLNVQALIAAGRAWAAGANPRKPWISPIFGKLDGLPPMHLFIGTKDILIADARRLRGLCLAVKADLSFYEYENMVHDWMLLEFKEGKLAAQRIAAIVRSYDSRGA